MKIPNILANGGVKLLSGLSNNKDSIIPMAFKDVISDCVTVATYKKEGGKDDPREKAIEEFGTGAFWLFGIPIIKGIVDKTLYPLLKLNPNLDLRLLKDKQRFDNVQEVASQVAKQNATEAFKDELNVLSTLKDKNTVLKSFTNEQLYKGLFMTKFLAATALTGVVLSKIIRYKQKTTKDRIQNDISKTQENSPSTKSIIDKKVKNSNIYGMFSGSKNAKNLSFNGALDLFMYNPIANTSLMDCVITGTRLKEARDGERKEVALKEGFQIAFVYLIARPLQLFFENIGKKLNLPIGLDPVVLFSKNAKENVTSAFQMAKDNGLYDIMEELEKVQKQNKSSGNIFKRALSAIKGAQKPANELQLENNLIKKIYEIAKEDINNPLIKLLKDNGNISVLKDKKTSKSAMSLLQFVESGDLKSTLNNLKEMSDQKILSNILKIRAYKALSVIANLAIGITATGAVEPLCAIWMRKKLNNGDNRNPAIVAQEKEMQSKAQETKLQ